MSSMLQLDVYNLSHWDHSETKYVHVSIALLPQDVTSWPGPCEPLQCIQP